MKTTASKNLYLSVPFPAVSLLLCTMALNMKWEKRRESFYFGFVARLIGNWIMGVAEGQSGRSKWPFTFQEINPRRVGGLFKLPVFGLLTLSEDIKVNILMDWSNHFLPVSIQSDATIHTYTPHSLRKKNESKEKEKQNLCWSKHATERMIMYEGILSYSEGGPGRFTPFL